MFALLIGGYRWPGEVDAYPAAVNAGLIVQETRCDSGMLTADDPLPSITAAAE